MFSNTYSFYLPILLLAGFLFFEGCSKSDDQRKFENESLSAPNDYTVTPTAGEIVSNDPDDWRISPMYQSRIYVGSGIGSSSYEPPYPNPLNYNQDLNIFIYISNIDNLDEINVYSFETNPATSEKFVTREGNISSPSLVSIRINGQDISGKSGGSEANGLYRIRIFDGDLNVITYGDIKIGPE